MSDTSESIAIIGIGARVPGAADACQYWSNLRAGVESIDGLSEVELLAAGVTPAELADPYYVRSCTRIPDVKDFDADFFRMTAREARFSDPQLKLMLEVSHSALEDAGLDPTTMGRDVGMFGAAGLSRYADFYIHGRLQQHDSANVVLNNSDYIATYTAYNLDLHGPSLTVLSACSSSLVAVHLACQSLLVGDCDVALAGGANIELPLDHGYRWGPGSVRSRDGHCRPFDAAANGTVFANGAGVVVLKRLTDAISDGDYIRAVVSGTALNNDGFGKMSFSAPSVEGQASVVVQAMSVAGVAPSQISYVEAHGTATPVGDPVEVAALTRAYQSIAEEPLVPGSIGIGSVKGNIGHTVPTAGVAGLIKLAMALDTEELPPSINFTAPNPALELDKTPFFVNHELRAWPRVEGEPRRAGISAFGVGGTNAHVVVTEGPVQVRTPSRERPRIVVWSGRSQAAVDAARTRLADFFSSQPDERFADAVATLQQGRTSHAVRAAVVGTDGAQAEAALRSGRVLVAADATVVPDVVFLFPGQGSQHARMAAGLYGSNAVFTAELDRCFAGLPGGGALHELWLGDNDAALRPTECAQPLLFAVEYALARMLLDLRIRPAAVIGHSIGELVAATVAGVLDVEDALRLAAIRGHVMQEQPPGSMIAVRAEAATVEPLLPPGFAVAVVNGPDQVVVAGPIDPAPGMERLVASGLTTTRLATSHAFHSAAMRPAVEPFVAAFDGVRLREPTIPVYSAAVGRLLTPREATDPRFWAQQLVEPVRFDRAVDAATDQGAHLLLEVGPGRTLTGIVAKHPTVTVGASVVVPLLPRGDGRRRDDERSVTDALASLWVHGHEPHWPALHGDEPLRRVPVPGYPYQRVRHWIDPTTGPAAPYRADAEQAPARSAEPVADAVTFPVPSPVRAASPFSTVSWIERSDRPASTPPAKGACALALLPADRDRALALLNALQRRGYQVVRVFPDATYSAGDTEYRVRPGLRADVEAVVAALRASGRRPELLVHGWAFDDWAPVSPASVTEQLDLSFHGLQTLVNAAGRAPSAGGSLPGLLVITHEAVDVSGGESVHPMKAILAAHVRTIAAETPGATCRMIDVARADEDDLFDELGLAADAPVVAVRAGRRWLPAELALLPEAGEPPLRRGGVYLVTGGLGGLGRCVARGLAATGMRPSLVLVGRSGTDPDASAAVVAELEALGAQVRVQACDVTDGRALARVLDITTARLGPVNGVLHLAGVPGGGMLAVRDRADADRVFQSKIHGVLQLEAAFKGRPPLDFFVSFSSRSALAGMVGSGDYAAANAFLDVHAATGRVAARTLSIGWPAWHSVGMAAAVAPVDPEPVPPQAHDYVTTLSAHQFWALDEHRVEGRAVLPGTGHVDLVVRAFRATFDPPADHTVVLEQVALALPLAVPKPRAVRVRFTADGTRFRFTLTSRPAGSDDPWLSHTDGFVGSVPGAKTPRTIDIEAAVAGLAPAEFPAVVMTTSRMFNLGPRWDCITGYWEGPATKLVRLSLPQQYRSDLDVHPLHPALLDMSTSILRDPDHDGLRLPFMYRRFAMHAPLPAELYSRIRRTQNSHRSIVGDIELIAADGTVVGEIEGFTMRLAERTGYGSAIPSAAPSAAPSVPAEAPHEDRLPAADSGLAPEQGTRLLIELLSARTPAHVLVRSFRDGVPVPLERTAVGAVDVASPTEVLGAATNTGTNPATNPATNAATVVEPPRAEPEPAPVPGPERNGAAPSVEERLRGLWTEVLGMSSIDGGADFFDLGGDSMAAVQLIGRIRDVFQVEFGIGVVFDHPSLDELAAVLRAQGAR